MYKSLHLKTLLLLAVMLMTTAYSMAQVVSVNDELWTEPFASGASGTTFSATSNWTSKVNPTTFVASDKTSLSYDSSDAMCSAGSGANMDGSHVWLNKNTTGYWQVSGIKLYNATKVKVSWAQGGASTVKVSYAFDGGSSYTELHSNTTAGPSIESSELNVSGHTTINLKFHRTSTKTNVRIDDLTLTATEVSTPNNHSLVYDGDGNGSVAATVDAVDASSGDDVAFGSTVVLTATPAANYEFKNWTDLSYNVVSTDNPYSFSMPDEDVALIANFIYVDPNTEYEVDVDNVTGGTITANPLKAKKGQTVTISTVVDDGYEFDEWDATVEVVLTGNANHEATFTMPAEDVIVSAKYNKLYTVTFSDGGSVRQTTAGGDVALPSRTAPAGFTFSGWATADVATETTTAPAPILTGSYAPTADVTLYPVYSRVDGNKTTYSVNIGEYADANNWIVNSGSGQYYSFSFGSTVTVSVTNSGYNGKVYSNDGIVQWRVYTGATLTISSSVAMSEITINNTSNNDFSLSYGGNSITKGEAFAVSGTSVSINVVGNTRITDISVVCDATTYYTSHPSIPVSITAAGYATFCTPAAMDFTDFDGLAYTAEVSDDAVTFNKVTGTVPANTGLLLKGTKDAAVEYQVPAIAESTTDVSGNALVGVNENRKINQTEGGKTNFVLLKKDGVVGFFKVNATNGFTVGAHTAYLSAAISDPAKGFFGFDDNTTAVNSVLSVSEEAAPAYNLQGQRVSDSYCGVVIVNGKKFVNK